MPVSASLSEWLTAQHSIMESLLIRWASINTGSFHVEGLTTQLHELETAFKPLGATLARRASPPLERINARGEMTLAPLGDSLLVVRRPTAPRRVLLAIHYDTVYSVDSPFQTVARLDEQRLCGPGVADAKGGLVVLLFALLAYERYVEQAGYDPLGWTVVLNADEEIGSPGSTALFREVAETVQLGLLFEPALTGGQLAGERKGSGNFSIVVQGRAAHAGRDFFDGRNAVVAAAELASVLHQLNGVWPDVTVNISRIDGGGPPNMVPDMAVLRLNIRYRHPAHEADIWAQLREAVREVDARPDFHCTVHGGFSAPPKPWSDAQAALFEVVQESGRTLGIELDIAPSGGVCDGNRLAAFGVPNLDTLGVRGGGLHSPQEFVELDSLVERAQLTALTLLRLTEPQIWEQVTGTIAR